MDLLADNIAQLKKLFPEAVTEGKVDFEILKALLGGEIEQRQEYYKFTWNGKEAARAYARTRSMGTLRPCRAESSGKDGTPGKFDSGNLYIEGDNLEVLKLLQGPYHKRVKMIYIDPPYNTGKDFVYPDNFRDSIGNYKALTGQTDSEGKSTRANPETSGRYHTDWLNMMYPRLILARNLLTDDGVIFISIDDSEQDNLKKLCNEVFGEENFVAQLIWQRAFSPKNDARFVSNSHDYVIMYAKSISSFVIGRLARTEEANARYSNPDNDPRGVWMSSDISVKTYNAECDYPITLPSGRVVEPPTGRCWSLSKNAFLERLHDNRIWFGPDGDGTPRIKRFLGDLKFDGMAPTSIMLHKDVGHSQEGAQELTKLLDAGAFDGPKPTRLLSRLITLAKTDKDSIILDFFSGSATTAHAVMQLNAEDGGQRKYIMVQLPEVCEEGTEAAKAGYRNICEIGKERIRRAAKKVVSEKWEEISREEKLRYGCKELARTDCLAKGNGSGETDLFTCQESAERRDVCAVGSNEKSGGIHSIEHCGRSSPEPAPGVSPVSLNRPGEQGGTGNPTASVRTSEPPCPYGHFGGRHADTSGSGENAECPFKSTNHCPLITNYCSDMGFKVFKLDTSNMVPWNPNADELDLYAAVDNVLIDRSTDDLLYEVMLKCNLPLTLPVERRELRNCGTAELRNCGTAELRNCGTAENTIYLVGDGALAVCLDKSITVAVAEEIVRLRDECDPRVPMQVVFRDSGFNDVTKTNVLQILKQAGFEEKSIQTI